MTEVKLSQETEAMWNDIKDLSTDFFGLKNIKVKDVATPLALDPTKLFLKLKAPVVLVSLENTLSTLVHKDVVGDTVLKYSVELVKGMAVVSKTE